MKNAKNNVYYAQRMECGDYGAIEDVFARTDCAKEQESDNVIAQHRLMEVQRVLGMKWLLSSARPMNVVGFYTLSRIKVCNIV